MNNLGGIRKGTSMDRDLDFFESLVPRQQAEKKDETDYLEELKKAQAERERKEREK